MNKAAIIVLLLIVSLFAQEEEKAEKKNKEIPTRLMLLNLHRNPYDDYNSNSYLWFSASQLLAKGSDYLGVELETDEYWPVRVAQVGVGYLVTQLLQGFSHEAAHYTDIRLTNSNATFRITKTSFTLAGTGVAMEYPSKLKQYDMDHHYLAGLCQNEINAHTLTRYQGVKSFGDAMSFLSNKLYDLKYIVATWNSQMDRKDPIYYLRLMRNQNIDLSKDNYLARTALADCLSFQTWESAFIIGRYLAKGTRFYNPLTFKMGDMEARPPLISHFLTTKGGFYNFSFEFLWKKKPLFEVQVGNDLDIFDGRVNTFRTGFQFYNLKLFPQDLWQPTFSPFAYINLGENTGFSMGTEVDIPLRWGVAISGRLAVNQKDLIENEVKRIKEGFHGELNLKIEF